MIQNQIQTEDSNRQIKLGAVISYLGIGINIVIGLIYTPWMIRSIGQNDYALYTLATSLIGMFTIDFGMSAAVTRFVSKYMAEGNQKAANNLLGIVYKLYSFISSIVFVGLVVVFFFIDTIYAKLTPEEIASFKVVYMIAGSYSIIAFPFMPLNGILTAYEKFVQIKACDLFNKVATVLLVVIALLCGMGLYALVTVNAFVGLATILMKYIIIKHKTPVKVNFRYRSRETLKEIFSFSVWSTLSTFSQNFLFSITPTILGMVSGSAAIAVFGFSNSLQNYVYILAMGVNGFFLPKISRIIAKGTQDRDILPLMIKVGRFQLYILLLICIGFISVGREFIYLLMGPEYRQSYTCTLLLISYSIFYYPQQIANTTIIALNKVKQQSLIFIATSLVNVCLSLLLSGYFGAIGAAVSICTALLLRTVLLNWLYHKEIHINVFTFFKECHLKLIPPTVIALALSIAVGLIPASGWIFFGLKALLIGCIFCVVMWCLAFNSFEKSFVRDILAKFKRRG